MNPWHDVSPGDKVPKEFTVIVEIPKGSMNKYELDKETGLLMLSRVLYSPVHYPGNYGFIPQTYWRDNDPVDVLILGTTDVHPLTMIRARPLGVIRMIDNKDEDDKIIAVPVKDPRFDNLRDIKDLPKHVAKELDHFFRIYKELQGIVVKIVDIDGRKEAEEAILEGMKLYQEKFKKS